MQIYFPSLDKQTGEKPSEEKSDAAKSSGEQQSGEETKSSKMWRKLVKTFHTMHKSIITHAKWKIIKRQTILTCTVT